MVANLLLHLLCLGSDSDGTRLPAWLAAAFVKRKETSPLTGRVEGHTARVHIDERPAKGASGTAATMAAKLPACPSLPWLWNFGRVYHGTRCRSFSAISQHLPSGFRIFAAFATPGPRDVLFLCQVQLV